VRPNKAGKTAPAEIAPSSSIDPLGQKIDRRPFVNRTKERTQRCSEASRCVERRYGAHRLTRARSRMVAMHPAALMKSEIECL